MQSLLELSRAIERLLGTLANLSGWLLLVLTGITCFDVVCRKLGIPIPFTKFQEMEWHLHTAIFSFWLGFNYTINAHPRVDSFVSDIGLRRKAWIELAGCLLFALPYTFVVMYFGWPFVEQSYLVNEHSEAGNGLPYRWVIKGVLFVGLVLLAAAVLSVVFKLVAFLFGRRSAQEVGLKLGPSPSEV
jgi:TRAP-type mannitol/chloroaromatic compound transport system permease small subunit